MRETGIKDDHISGSQPEWVGDVPFTEAGAGLGEDAEHLRKG